MSKSRITKNYEEASMLIKKFRNNEHLLAMAMVQLTEREKVRVVNQYRKSRGEPLLPTDPPMMEGNRTFKWVVDVPKEWVSLTGNGRNY